MCIRDRLTPMLKTLVLAVCVSLPLVADGQQPSSERAEYQVKLGTLDAGSGVMEVTGREVVDGHDTYHVVLRIEGGLGPLRIDAVSYTHLTLPTSGLVEI